MRGGAEISINFLNMHDDLVGVVTGKPGDRLLEAAQAKGMPLEGTCEGQMACSTCHIIVAAEDFSRLPVASEEEEDILDLAAHATGRSRLACQIILSPELDGMTVSLPPEHRDMQGR